MKGDSRVPMDPGAHTLLHQPNPRETAHGGFPGNPRPHPTSCCASLEEHRDHHCHPENHSPSVFGLQHIKVSFGLPSRWIYFCAGIFWHSCSSGTHNHTHDLSLQGNSMSPSVGAPILTTQYNDFRAHPQLFIPSPADNLLLSGAQE